MCLQSVSSHPLPRHRANPFKLSRYVIPAECSGLGGAHFGKLIMPHLARCGSGLTGRPGDSKLAGYVAKNARLSVPVQVPQSLTYSADCQDLRVAFHVRLLRHFVLFLIRTPRRSAIEWTTRA